MRKRSFASIPSYSYLWRGIFKELLTYLWSFKTLNNHIMKYLFLIFLYLLSSCTHQKSTDNTIPVLNIGEKDYPTRKINIHDIADVEYIPLESLDNTLVGASLKYFSEKYIVTSDGVSGGNIYFFDHSGKLLWKFNRRGPGPGDFSYLYLCIVDFEQEECYVHDANKHEIFIYSFEGDYKRSIPMGGFIGVEVGKATIEDYVLFTNILHYDADFLLGYSPTQLQISRGLTDKSSYYLISKKDGSRYPLDLKVKNGITDYIYNGKDEKIGYLNHSPLLQNGNECWITELSSDTIYSLVDRNMVPVAVQHPSIHSTTPPFVIFPIGFTDYFLVFNVVSLFTDENDPWRPYDESKTLVWNRSTNNLEHWEIYNPDISQSKSIAYTPIMYCNGWTMKNCGSASYGPGVLIDKYKKGELKGRLKEIAANLREDDNDVIVLVKYKEGVDWSNLAEYRED